jgi:hypothetical protein
MRALHKLLFLTAAGLFASATSYAADATAPNGDPVVPAMSPQPQWQDSLVKALTTDATPMLDLRYRYENVDASNFTKAAAANTVRTRAGFQTGVFDDFKGVFQVENVLPVGAEHYNDGTNGLTAYPRIADPRQTAQLYQANMTWQGLPQSGLTFGRQALAFDNERWIGISDWRQLGQTMDALSAHNHSITDLDLAYSYVFHVNRAYGPDARVGFGGAAPGEYDMHSHLFHAAYTGIPDIKLIGYSYLLDMSNAAANSTATTGARVEAKHNFFQNIDGLFNAEYAYQGTMFNNPSSYGFNYYLVEPGVSIGPVTGKVAYETMEGNGVAALQAPLDTGHAFNGWAERFLTTPVNGLDNVHVALEYKSKDYSERLGPTVVRGIWYDFSANNGGLHYGNEYDAWIGQTFFQHYSLGLQYADYEADGFSSDTQKIALLLQIKY